VAKQVVYPFTFGDKSKSDLLGGKGANIAEMVQMGLPVPPGFTSFYVQAKFQQIYPHRYRAP